MDKLTREAKEHDEIYESLAVFEETFTRLKESDGTDCLKSLRAFLDGHIVEHFKFEEQEIFPPLLTACTDEEKKVIEKLRQEHGQILAQIELFGTMGTTCDGEQTGGATDTLQSPAKEILKRILSHAREEDAKLFPLLKKYHIELE